MEILGLTVGILKEFLEDIPEEYNIIIDKSNIIYPASDIMLDDTCKEIIIKIDTE